MMKAAAIVSLGLLSLAGCSSWPENGSGGLAEERPPLTVPVDQQRDAVAERYRQLGCATWRLEELKHNGAEDYTPGLVWLAERGAARAARSLGAQLYGDADIDLIALRGRIAAIEQQILEENAPGWSEALRPEGCAS